MISFSWISRCRSLTGMRHHGKYAGWIVRMQGVSPIVAMTANAFAEDVREALRAGMNAHVSKPIEVDRLLATLEDLLS